MVILSDKQGGMNRVANVAGKIKRIIRVLLKCVSLYSPSHVLILTLLSHSDQWVLVLPTLIARYLPGSSSGTTEVDNATGMAFCE